MNQNVMLFPKIILIISAAHAVAAGRDLVPDRAAAAVHDLEAGRVRRVAAGIFSPFSSFIN